MTERVKESDLVLPALRLMTERPDGFITTADLISGLEQVFQPAGQDAKIIDGRNDSHFSQKVRNLVSHRASPSNFICKGYADYLSDREGLQITPQGKALFEKIAA